MKPSTTTSALPTAVKSYLDAVNRFEAVVAADCITGDASVFDENQSYVGRDSIRAGVAECSEKYRPVITVMRASVKDDDISLAVAVSGQFPGSSVTRDYAGRRRRGKRSPTGARESCRRVELALPSTSQPQLKIITN